MSNLDLIYLINEAETWPPRRRPSPPFGPSELEVMRSCPLRSCFEVSPDYERRLGFAARVGSAFHHTLQSFSYEPLPTGSLDQTALVARQRFEHELRQQLAEANDRVRERGLPRDQARMDCAAEAAVAEALRIAEEDSITFIHVRFRKKRGVPTAHTYTTSSSPPPPPDPLPPVEIEVPVQSGDGLLRGRVDRVEHQPEGVRLVDYKSALRGDLPGRYERQVQLYAYLWHETRGEWPTDGLVHYPLTATIHPVSIEPAACQQLAAETTELINRAQTEPQPAKLAIPGDVCQVCDFRPWCHPFWQWQAAEPSATEALHRAKLGFAGKLTRLELSNHIWHLSIAWRNAQVRLVAPEERFPQLRQAQLGQTIRVLDTTLKGLRHAPQAVVTEATEVFVIANPNKS